MTSGSPKEPSPSREVVPADRPGSERETSESTKSAAAVPSGIAGFGPAHGKVAACGGPGQHRLDKFEKRTEWPLAVVAMIFLAAYSVRVLAQPTGTLWTVIEFVLWVTYGSFVIDYLGRLYLAPNRGRWFCRHLLDLMIVALPLLRPLRLLRLIVLIAALQKALGDAIRGRIALFTAASAVLLIYAASLAILDAERGHSGAKIKDFGAALWWSFTTVTTVGYGDISPVTGTGRLVAVALMLGGISLVGIVTATITSFIVEQVAKEDTDHQAATLANIDALRVELDKHIDALRDDFLRSSETQKSEIGSLELTAQQRDTPEQHQQPNP